MTTRPKILAGNLSSSCVTEAKIATGAVTVTKLGADCVTAAKIGDDVLNSEHYVAGSIDAEHLAANSVDSDAYVDGSIDPAHFAASAVETTAIAAANVTHAKLEANLEHYIDVLISSEEILALHTTPKQLVATPGANKALILIGAFILYDYATAAYADIAAGDDLTVRYTDGSGATVGTIETTSFLDQAGDEVRWVDGAHTTAVEIVANAALVLSLAGAITTGAGVLKVRVFYRTIDTNIAPS